MPIYSDYGTAYESATVCEPEQPKAQDMDESAAEADTGVDRKGQAEKLSPGLSALLQDDIERLKSGELKLVPLAESRKNLEEVLQIMGEFERRTKYTPSP